MSITHYEMNCEERKMILEVIEKARNQNYTAEKLCDLQKVIDTQYYYWWINDMKKEEYGLKLFTDDFISYFGGMGEYSCSKLNQAKNAKYVNSFMSTVHMGHQPLVWMKDDSNARGVFIFEGHMTYLDNPEELVEDVFIYCNDFVKHDDGQWYISAYRLIPVKSSGELRADTIIAPEDHVFDSWEEN